MQTIQTAQTNRLKRRNALMIRRARLSYRVPMLDLETRIQLLFELASIGEEQDIEPVKNIIASEEEDKKIKDAAKIVLEELQKRLRII